MGWRGAADGAETGNSGGVGGVSRPEVFTCEVKAANEINDPIVQGKAAAARTWISAANTVAKEMKRKSWRYALIPHDAITEASTLAGMVKTYSVQ